MFVSHLRTSYSGEFDQTFFASPLSQHRADYTATSREGNPTPNSFDTDQAVRLQTPTSVTSTIRLPNTNTTTVILQVQI